MNTIRTPKTGRTSTSRLIALAVDDEKWQEYRVAMKGKPTRDKLALLKAWFDRSGHVLIQTADAVKECATCIQLDNYIKALCRAGALKPGESLDSALQACWRLEVLK